MYMVDHPGLEAVLRKILEEEFASGAVDLAALRDLVSSPRLMSYGVRAFNHSKLVMAGDTFLDAHTMLADGVQKTYAISFDEWEMIKGEVEYVDRCDFRDDSVMQIQVWSTDPLILDEFAMIIAVALSYKKSELLAESRISSALHELTSPWGYYTDGF
ncbi:hypothetical protein [Pseudomonas sp. 02C 26]|uniref:hypothetical protein n=1 Tax=Pseudomonas sp. 02C 26 TaxID=2054914 RepID=UPI0012FEFBF2|nr:hypothetical protein [Pseudomonas sp. 02C 26]